MIEPFESNNPDKETEKESGQKDKLNANDSTRGPHVYDDKIKLELLQSQKE